MKLWRTMLDVTGGQIANMAAAKQEVILSQLLYGIEMKI
jgi:hypothetical protein